MDIMDKEKVSVLEESVATAHRPLPDDFRSYLPWACNQLELEYAVFVNKIHQSKSLNLSNYSSIIWKKYASIGRHLKICEKSALSQHSLLWPSHT